jgi:hypothetical protein
MAIEFINETSESEGTAINRENLMAIQGFVATTTVLKTDGSIVETNSRGETLTTTFGDDGTVTEVFEGQFVITKVTRVENGIITEVLV